MYGAIIGDIIGSTYEWHNVKYKNFELFPEGSRFTDDSVLSVAVADKILNARASDVSSKISYGMWYKQYYHRFPNAGYGQMFSNWADSESMKIQRSYGNGADKEEIRQYITKNYKYKLLPLDEIREKYVFDSRASYSVPPAIEAFLEAESYEDAIRNAISIGGDSDTIACMTGGIAHAYYRHIPKEIFDKSMSILDVGLKRAMNQFAEQFSVEY